jgi:hypothetical protein
MPAWLSGPRRAQKLIPSHSLKFKVGWMLSGIRLPLLASNVGMAGSRPTQTFPTQSPSGKSFIDIPIPAPQAKNGPPWMWRTRFSPAFAQRAIAVVGGSQVFFSPSTSKDLIGWLSSVYE